MRFAVIGHPVAHSKSPLMHGAAYRALGLGHSYEKIDTPHDQLAHRVAELRHHDLDGLNVTVPHKQAVLALVDHVAPSAAAIGAANTLVRNADGTITAHNTDAPGLAEELALLAGAPMSGATAPGADAPDPLAGRSAVVIGSGGAARAAVFALASLGLTHITIRARRPLEDAVAIARAAGARDATVVQQTLRTTRANAEPGPAGTGAERGDLRIIVQCTTAGMEHGAPGGIAVEAIDWASVPREAVAYDVVYAPALTPFLARAAEAGLRCDDGLGMLVAQGAVAFELWLGVQPPRDVMRRALDGKEPP